MYSVRLVADYLEQAEILEAEARKLREKHAEIEEAKSTIQIGKYVYDVEQREVGIVTKLKNGSNDFEVDFLKPKMVGRGFLFPVKNWRLATVEEIILAKELYEIV